MKSKISSEDYLYLIEIIISTNNQRKSSEIFNIISKMVDNRYINYEEFKKIILDNSYFALIKKHLDPDLIDCEDYENCRELLENYIK
ncbi:hypothetical protein [Arcobacter vandammei]|uniref:hypothetical protein n=1 Tax=Arcobacter vandammei TaxID=2782243 RepID=UPI0018DF7797|nr:hypothetical protein [Arcobacter vandammei]